MPDYKLAILAAGRGTHMGVLTEHINKALLPVRFRAVISHVIEKFPPDVEIVVALGHERDVLKEYLEIAHQERTFRYVTVDKTSGKGSGPGYSLLQCKEHLECPFVLSTVDTIVLENVPRPTVNWLGIAPVDNTKRFNSVKLQDGFVVGMEDKIHCDNTHAFIGLCGIRDYNTFWQALEGDTTLVGGELQLSNGLKTLIDSPGKLCGVEFSWFDTGTVESYTEAQTYFSKDLEAFDFSKTNEHLYFVGKKVIKYFEDPDVAGRRVQRSTLLKGFVPCITRASSHFYAYRKIPGTVLYEVLNDERARAFFDWLKTDFWKPVALAGKNLEQFRKTCRAFYYYKTMKRVAQYWESTGTGDAPSLVNGNPTPALADLLDRVDWETLANGMPSRFHGDLQFDNVLVTKDGAQPFVLLDWRPDFGGCVEYGDRYYDLAKLYGGMLLPYNLIKKSMFSYAQKEERIYFDVASMYSLNSCRGIYEQFLIDNGYDLNRVKLLTALIFLNMSPLHKKPFNFLLHHLGKLELGRVLEE